MGVLGVPPGDMQLRDLYWAAIARQRCEWDATASIISTIANVHRDEKKRKRPFSMVDFHPLRNAEESPRQRDPYLHAKQMYLETGQMPEKLRVAIEEGKTTI